jgi:subtilase family serine protease
VLALSSTGTPASPTQIIYGSENGWRSGGGGVSSLETQPSWQNPACATWSTTFRCAPDISSLAVNVPVYDTFGHGGWLPVNGTSISAPDWGAFFTLVNSGRAAVGKNSLSQAAPDLYTIFYSGNYLSDFHDITAGTNGNCGSQCTAVAGYDLVTGIGSYKANTLYPALVADPN